MQRSFVELSEFSLRCATGEWEGTRFKLENVLETPLIESSVVKETLEELRDDPALLGSVYLSQRYFRIIHLEEMSQIRSVEECEAYLDETVPEQIGAYTLAVLDDENGLPYSFSGMKDVNALAGLFRTENLVGATGFLQTNQRLPKQLHPGSFLGLGALLHYLQFEQEGSLVTYLELGETVSTLFILSANGLIECHEIKSGFAEMVEIVQSKLDIKYAGGAVKIFLNAVYDLNEFADALLAHLKESVEPILSAVKVRTGQEVAFSLVGAFPANQTWIQESFARAVGTKNLRIDFSSWLQNLGVDVPEPLRETLFSPASLSLIQLIRLSAPDNQTLSWQHDFFADGLPKLPDLPPEDMEAGLPAVADREKEAESEAKPEPEKPAEPVSVSSAETSQPVARASGRKPSPAILYGSIGGGVLLFALFILLLVGGGESTRHLRDLGAWTDGEGWTTINLNPQERFGLVFAQPQADRVILNQPGWIGADRMGDVLSLHTDLPMRWATVTRIEVVSGDVTGGFSGIRITSGEGVGSPGVFLASDGRRLYLLHRQNHDGGIRELVSRSVDANSPLWLRMERRREEIRSFISTDGESWTELPECLLPGAPLRGGLALHVTDGAREGIAIFTNWRFGSF